jgi:hypothetical protein
MRKQDRGRFRDWKRVARPGWLFTGLMVVSLLAAACGTAPPEADEQSSVAIVASLPATSVVPATEPATPMPTDTATPLPTDTATPAPTATQPPAPVDLVILHTNDNWGETEPCG